MLTDQEHFAFAVLDSLSAHIAVLGRDGRILYTNQAWKRFARANAIRVRPDTLDVNYLEICQEENALQSVQNLEKELGKTLLAFGCHDLKASALDADELSKIQKLENDLSISLVAVDA